eukprot:6210009-Prymnesium_polylepis.1
MALVPGVLANERVCGSRTCSRNSAVANDAAGRAAFQGLTARHCGCEAQNAGCGACEESEE